MTISPQELEKIAHLSHLDVSDERAAQLSEEITSIMNFVAQLSTLDTSKVAPLFHPLALHQRLRADEVTEEECIAEIEAIAPLFEDNLYLVPKVLEGDK